MWIAPSFAGSATNYSTHDNSLLRYVAPNGDQLMLSEAASGVFYGGEVVNGAYMGTGGGSVTTWSASQWHHVAYTYSTTAGRFRLYIDGAMISEGDFSPKTPASGGVFTVDGDPFGLSAAFMIDEVRILNIEETPQQVQADATRTTPFADNEIDVALSGLAGGQITYQATSSSGSSCGSASFVIAPLTNVNQPGGLLAAGSTSLNLSFTSASAASCRYSVGSSTGWNSMLAFDSSGPVVAHSGTIYGLSSDPRVVNSVYIACDNNPSYVTTYQYRTVAAPSGSYPRIGSIWSGEYVYTNAPNLTSKIQLYLGAPFTAAQATAIRAANPGAIILPTINATETTNGTPVVPDSYFLKDVNGNKIQDWPGNYLLNLTNPVVAQFLGNYAAQVASQSNYAFDGIFFDNVKTTIAHIKDIWGNPVAIDANGDGILDDPATLDAQWSAGVYAEIAAFRQALPNAYAEGHIGDVPPSPSSLSVFNGDSLAFPAVDVREGTLAFNSLQGAYNSWFTAGQTPMTTMVQSSPPNQIAYGYGFLPEATMLPSTQQFAQSFYPNMRFGLATALMNNGYSTYDFGDTGAPVAWWYDEYNFNLGTPLGPATQIGQTNTANMLLNPGFEGSMANWSFLLSGPAVATISLDPSIVAQGNTSAHVSVTTIGTSSWMVSLEQDNVPLVAGVNYQLQFWARSDTPRNISIQGMGGAPNYPLYGLWDVVAINSSWTLYTVSFVSSATANDGRIEFFMGDQPGNVWIDGVVLSQPPTAIYRRDFTNGTVLLNGTASPQTISLGSGFQRFSGSQAPMSQYIIDDSSASFSASGSWSTVTYDTGYSSMGGAEVPTGPYYHAWNRTLHQLSGAGSAQWNLNIPADGTYTIQAWLPAAPTAGSWSSNAVYQVVSGGAVIATFNVNQTTAAGGDQWHAIGTLNLTAAGNPQVRISNGGSGLLIADALYVTSAALYNNGAPASSVALAPMDGILLQRQNPVAPPAGLLTNVLNTTTWQPTIAPSSLVSLVGYGFGGSTLNYTPTGNLLPTSLGGVSATIDGIPAPVYSVSPTQIVVVSPDDANIGPVPVQLSVNGTTYSSTVTLQKLAPALFPVVSGGITYGQAWHSNGTAVSASSPAAPGEGITLIASGLGPTNPATPATQTVTGWDPVALPLSVTIGGIAATVNGAAKVSPGVYVIYTAVPSSIGAGNQAVQVGVSGFTSPGGVFLPTN